MGSTRIRNLAAYEAWAMVSHTPIEAHNSPDGPIASSRPHDTSANVHLSPLIDPSLLVVAISNNSSSNTSPPSGEKQQVYPRNITLPYQRGRVWGEGVTIIRRPDSIVGYPLYLHATMPKIPGEVGHRGVRVQFHSQMLTLTATKKGSW